jgi:hypothetical protein
MEGYRQMRRQSRRIRRGGMQPMFMVSGDPGQFPTPFGALLARWAWRYRSELAPLAVTAGLAVTGAWAHAERPGAAVPILLGSGAVAVAVAAFGGRAGLAPIAERAYAGAVLLSGGAWLALAAALGPLTAPLPAALAIGAAVLSVPWWAHRRRRAKVRVERALAAWPDIARAVGLAGSAVMSATVDVWGWRARLRLARGQTITDVIARIPAIESGLGTFRGAVRVYPTPDDRANRFELRVLDADPHADAIPWPGPSIQSITEPAELGPLEDAMPCRVLFLRRNALVGGVVGSGKSGGLNVLMGNLTACADVVIWGIDLKRGMELGPWAECIDRLAVNPEQASALLRDAAAILKGRAEYLSSIGRRTWEPTPEMPALVIIIDEYAELSESPEAMHYTDEIARLGRALAVTLLAATQRPTQKVMGQGAVRSQMDLRICFRVREQRDVDLVLGQGMLSAGWNAHKLNAPGKFLVSAPEHDIPRRARAYLVTDDMVAETSALHSQIPRGLDRISRDAMLNARQQQATAFRPEYRSAGNSGESPEEALWLALLSAPEEGWEIGDLMRISRMTRTTLYRYLQELVRNGRAYQAGRGRWRARTTGDDHDA